MGALAALQPVFLGSAFSEDRISGVVVELKLKGSMVRLATCEVYQSSDTQYYDDHKKHKETSIDGATKSIDSGAWLSSSSLNERCDWFSHSVG